MKKELTYLIQFTLTRKLQLLACLAIMFSIGHRGSIEMLRQTVKKIVLKKGVYMDRELNSLIGMELKSQMLDSRNDVLRTNKLEKVIKMVISLNDLDNFNNLKDGLPSNALFMYYVTGPEYSMHFEQATPQYKKLKNDMITSLTLKITDQSGKLMDQEQL